MTGLRGCLDDRDRECLELGKRLPLTIRGASANRCAAFIGVQNLAGNLALSAASIPPVKPAPKIPKTPSPTESLPTYSGSSSVGRAGEQG